MYFNNNYIFHLHGHSIHEKISQYLAVRKMKSMGHFKIFIKNKVEHISIYMFTKTDQNSNRYKQI